MKAVLTVAAVAGISCTSFSQMFDVDFQSADQGLNQTVTTGAPPDHVSAILFGTPTVVPAFGTLTNQPLVFNSDGQSPIGSGYYYTQIELAFANVPLPSVDLAFDMVDTGSGHLLTVFFDTPTVRNFYFDNGQISFWSPSSLTVNLGAYQMGQAYHFDIQLDYLLNQWSFMENNTLLGTGAFNPDGNLQSIRFNYSADGPNISGTAIDNILVVVPEPSSLSLLACASCLFIGHLSCNRKNLTT